MSANRVCSRRAMLSATSRSRRTEKNPALPNRPSQGAVTFSRHGCVGKIPSVRRSSGTSTTPARSAAAGPSGE